jgi:GNAT superfamily N-acetyltransferase
MTGVMIHTAHYMTGVMMVQGPGAPPPGMTEINLLRPAASDTEAVLAMLVRSSRTSLFHRFHSFTDGAAYYSASLRDRPIEQMLLAWCRSTCVGVADLGVSATGTVDLGVLVEDAWQRRGVGTRLAASLLDNARAHGVTTVHADVLGDDQFILRILRRIGPLTVSIEYGGFSIDIDLCSPPGQPSDNRRPVGLGTVAGA